MHIRTAVIPKRFGLRTPNVICSVLRVKIATNAMKSVLLRKTKNAIDALQLKHYGAAWFLLSSAHVTVDEKYNAMLSRNLENSFRARQTSLA